MSIYERAPVYETRDFTLRLIRREDAEDLLKCYSDPVAVAHMNPDRCTSDFYYTSIEEMRGAIDYWLLEYSRASFIRFAIIAKDAGRAVGTVEMFGGDFGVLRIDICTEYETERSISQLTALALGGLRRDFAARRLLVRAGNTPDRAKVYAEYGFKPQDGFRPSVGYWEYLPRGMAYCGLACDLCSENAECPGCRERDCADANTCHNLNCCAEKGLNGCWECPEFSCGKGLIANPRMRAFCECVRELGEEETLARLFRNKADGIVYHEPGKLTGDYDKCGSIEEIKELVRHGIARRD